MRTTEPKRGRLRGVGADLRAIRRARGRTLAELAGAVGRSVGWLSQVERGITAPAVDDLRRLAEALRCPVSLFFGLPDAPPEERGYVVRAGHRRPIGTMSGGIVEELLSPDLGGSFQMLRCVMAPGAALPEVLSRGAEEAGFIVSGALDVTIGTMLFHLREGDSFRFSHETVHWRNPGSTPCVTIWIIAPPVY